jgi:hypothetical protein
MSHYYLLPSATNMPNDDNAEDSLLNLHDDLEDPTTGKNEDDMWRAHQATNSCLRMTRYCGIVMSCIVGCFLEGAIMGVLYLVDAKVFGFTNLDGKDITCVVALLLCTAIAFMALAVIRLLRSLVSLVFAIIYEASTIDAVVRDELEQLKFKIIATLDFWFTVGCLFGILGSWGITYLALHLNDTVVQTLVDGLTQPKLEIALSSYN